MAPPSMLPLWSFTRYFTAAKVSEYLVAIPKTPVIHIQNTAPGPPAMMAVPTPTMLPVPMVADRAVHKAPNWLMSPGASGSLVTDSLMAVGSFRWMNPVRKVKKMWLPSSSTSIGGPHTKPSMALMAFTIISMNRTPLLRARRHRAREQKAPSPIAVRAAARATRAL